MEPAKAVRDSEAGVTISVRCIPGAGRSEISGMYESELKVRVRAPAIEGRANEELIDFLAGLLGVRPGRVTLLAGRKSRSKKLQVDGVNYQEVVALLSRIIPSDRE